MFAHDNEGSTGEEDPCADDYRGPEPFSEPETRAIRDFVNKWTNIKIAINFHAFGNLFIIPFNYDTVEGNQNLAANFTKAKQFYDHAHQNAGFPNGNKMGNGVTTVKYPANGEASDYFLAEKGVYSTSPELGTNNKFSDKFFVDSVSKVETICKFNYPWIHYMIKQLHPSINLSLIQLKKSHELMREVDI